MAEQHKPRRQRPAWVLDHLRRYVETNGEDGHIWKGVPTLLLTTTGRRSSQPNHPLWYLNLVATPRVQVQVAGNRFPARARTAAPDEKPALWQLMAGIWPDYAAYQARTEREIPVVILERVAEDDPTL